MGNSPACLGPMVEATGIFPGVNSVTESLNLQAESLQLQTGAGILVSAPAGMVPVVGPILAAIVTLLSSTDFSGVNSAFLSAKIHESILENDIHHYNAEIVTIRNSMTRMKDRRLTAAQLHPEIVYALRRSEYLFELFKNKNHLFYRYPLVSMSWFIKIANIFSALNTMASTLDPSMKLANDRNLAQMRNLIEDYKSNFIRARLPGITWGKCKPHAYSRWDSTKRHIYDRPWSTDDQPRRWADGIILWIPNTNNYNCETLEEEYPYLRKYKDSDEYKQKLREYYQTYFNKAFPSVE